MNILEKMQHEKLLQQHVETLRARYKDEDLSVLELQERFKVLAADSTDPMIEDSMREMYTLEYKLVNSLIEAAMPPIPEPAEMLEKLKQTNPAAAEALQHQLGIEALEDAVATAQAALDYAIERNFNPDSYGYKEAAVSLEAANSALAKALATPPPHFQRLNKANLAAHKAQYCRDAARSLEGSSIGGSIEAREEYMAQADAFEAEANSLRNYNFFAPKGEGAPA